MILNLNNYYFDKRLVRSITLSFALLYCSLYHLFAVSYLGKYEHYDKSKKHHFKSHLDR